MKINKNNPSNFGLKLIGVVSVGLLLAQVAVGESNKNEQLEDFFFEMNLPFDQNIDTNNKQDEKNKLKFPIPNTQSGLPESGVKNSFDLNNPKNIKTEVDYNPDSNTYSISQKIGDSLQLNDPTQMSFEEYYKYRSQIENQSYYKQRLDALGMFNTKPTLPELKREGLFDRLFGGNSISIKPQGDLNIMAGIFSQNMRNPNVPLSSQKYTIPDFDMNMQVNLAAQIGTKLKLNISNNTASTVGQQNENRKIEYTGDEDGIIKKIEAGNVEFKLKSALIPGMSSLFGLKTQMQFGKLWVTGVVSQQKSQRKSMTLKNGAQTQTFEVKINDYEENKNFLLAQYFHDNYDKALEKYPIINSQVVINKVEVWVTNRTGGTQNVRDAISFMDLGEKNPYNSSYNNGASEIYPDNRANELYDRLQRNNAVRQQSSASQAVVGMGLTEGIEFQRSTMRKLNTSEYNFQPQLGYVSLNITPNSDDIIGVAYSYTYNGKVYQVGEFSGDISPDSTSQKIIFLKLLKGNAARVKLPIWNLMMKNIYNIGGYGISKDNFKLNVFYEDPGGGQKRYLPEGDKAGTPIIELLNLDRLNANNDPYPDGVFDFVDGITILPNNGKVIFPKLEPFGEGLKYAFGGNTTLERKYLYDVLYDSTKAVVQQLQANNRFLIKGEFASTTGSDIRLNGFNIPEGSVSVTAGGQILQEGTDYSIDYSGGVIRILNKGILSSGVPINIQYEDNGAYGQNVQGFVGTRFDYYFNDKLTLGATYMRLTERPITTNVTQGNDPIKNSVIGLDANYQSEAPWITRTLDKFLPNYSTSATSLISASAEVAGVFPGHSKYINIVGDEGGSVFIDDFEGAASSIDLKGPVSSWSLASTPANATGPLGQTLFPEATLINDLKAGANRANLAWYNIEPSLVLGGVDAPSNIKKDTVLEDYWRQIETKEIFPKKSTTTTQNVTSTFDLGYYPKERGPYNFDASNIDQDGKLLNPESRWAGIQRSIDQSDFESSNVEYITFWMLDPYIYNPSSRGGYLYFNLGDVSEDVLKDSRLSFENGIPSPKDLSKLDRTTWGFVPKFQQQITRAFDLDAASRKIQDVGYDELDDLEEQEHFKAFLAQAAGRLGTGSAAYQSLINDPASDNFHHYRGSDYDNENLGVLARYKKYNNPHGNSPIDNLNSAYTVSGTNIPESEDINKDNTLNETEAYYQYKIKVEPNMQVNTNYIVNKTEALVTLPSGRTSNNTWYQFKIPIKEYDKAVGGISDFRSIRFMRMFMNGFSDSVTLRFAQLQLDRSNWRKYNYSLVNPDEHLTEEQQNRTTFGLTSVSVDQNSSRDPVPYVMPPGINKQKSIATTGEFIAQDEQSISMQVCGLRDGDGRSIFKEIGTDMRQYNELKMFIHAESVPNNPDVKDGDLYAFIRIGSDFTKNYYEYKIPLAITLPNTRDANLIWPEQNRLVINLQNLIDLKSLRNSSNQANFIPFEGVDVAGNKITVIGNPNLGDVKNIMLGVYNPKKSQSSPLDDGMDKCVEVWFDEMRLVGLDEKGGYAASGQVNLQLADFGTAHFGGSMHTIGYGSINQKVNERFRDTYTQYEANTNLNLGKVMPKNWGLQLPVYFGYNQSVSNPEYDPYDGDVKLADKLSGLSGSARDSVAKAAQEFTSITSFNMNNVRLLGNPEKSKVPKIWSLRNWDLNYSYNKQYMHSPTLLSDEYVTQRFNVGYNYAIKGKSWEPFKKAIKTRSKWALLAKDFNVNFLPSNITFRNEMNRVFNETIVRNIDANDDYVIPAYYYKNFVWNRNYSLNWDLTKSLKFNYAGLNVSRIDEPEGRINTAAKRDTMWDAISGLGRNTYFNQTFESSYSLPTKKIPALDWTTINVMYSSTFNWTAASLIATDLGNTIANTQMKQINGDLNFASLYNKSRHLKLANKVKIADTKEGKLKNMISKQEENGDGGIKESESFGGGKSIDNKLALDRNNKLRKNYDEDKQKTTVPPKPKRKTITEKDIKNAESMTPDSLKNTLVQLNKAEKKKNRKAVIEWRRRRQNIAPNMSNELQFGTRVATMLKKINFSYVENQGTILPGYMDSTTVLGSNIRNSMNGMDFAFGYQPNKYWIDQQMQQGMLSKDSLMNNSMVQTYSRNINVTAVIEPIRNLRADITWNEAFTRNQSAINKYNNTSGEFELLNPYYTGSFNISYIALGGFFDKNSGNDKTTATFDQFMSNRAVISRRLGSANPYTNGVLDPNDPNYYKGYTAFSQDVIVPAFLAAYSGKDANVMALINYENEGVKSNPFKFYFPMPNWSLTYNGLSMLPGLSSILESFTLRHQYSGRLAMNSFNNNYYYNDMLGVGMPSFIDSTSGNYIPFFAVPNITIQESFGPFLGVDMAFKNSLSVSIRFEKSRMSSLSLVDYQVSETRSNEFKFGAGYRAKGMNLPFTVFGINRLKNDVIFKMDFGIRDDVTTTTYMASNSSVNTAGQKVISITPNIDYVINDRLKVSFYFDRRQSFPRVNTSYPIATTRGGLRLSFSLAGQ